MNIAKLLLLVFISLLPSCTKVQHAHQTTNDSYISNQQNITNLTNSVVGLVQSNISMTFRPYCSAFFIRPTYIVTAAHCLKRPNPQLLEEELPGILGQEVLYSTNIQWQENITQRPVPYNRATIVAINPEGDIALLKTFGFVSNFYLNISTKVPQLGDSTYTMSLPGTLPWVFSSGIVSLVSTTRTGVTDEILTSASIFFGSSGCPLVNNNGNVIGIASSIAFRQATYAIFVSINRLLLISNPIVQLN